MTAYEVWQHIRSKIPYSEWEPPPWFKWTNTLTPKKVDELIGRKTEQENDNDRP